MAQTVLIIDDDPTQRRLLEAVVSRHGYDVTVAKGGHDALAFLKSGQSIRLQEGGSQCESPGDSLQCFHRALRKI